MGIKKAAFWPAAVALLALILEIPRLTEDGILDSDGDHKREKGVFKFFVKVIKPTKLAERLICNSSNWLESGTFASYPDFLAIGPLLASNRPGKSTGYFWQEDSGCLAWLDQQPPKSVIYVALGSFAMFNRTRFEELALGLELTNRPFLWVVRENIVGDINNAYPTGFKERLDHWGCIVNWAPQQKVLSHPSIACFISHCGWNSTLEGISNGIPFLCWPYFGDQLFNQSYICDYLKIGLELNKDESGSIRCDVIKNKLERVLGDEGVKERLLDLQAKILNSVRKGGSSHKNFEDFLSWIKD